MRYDVVVIGAGPAGLSAALVLARACKSVLLVDANEARNAVSPAMHGFLTRDGISPSEFRAAARAELRRYETVEQRVGRVDDVSGGRDSFELAITGGEPVQARRVLLATGLDDRLPDLPGLKELWGRSVVECPYCHGWEHRGAQLGYLLPDGDALEIPQLLLGWSRSLVVFTNARVELTAEARERLQRRHIALEERPLARVVGDGQRLLGVQLRDTTLVPCQALFVRADSRQTALVRKLGLALDDAGAVRVDADTNTSIPGICAAGDSCSHAHGALAAAAAGSVAAHALNRSLTLDLPEPAAAQRAAS
jgi:thioredoxin reductase